MTKSSAFTLLSERTLSEVDGVAKLWKHKESGAEILSISNADENKCFGVSFRTPPKDSTGVAHILEHSVLCGSDKYPVKEPFIALLKGSLQTFLNAFTFPDKTCYPVASANLQDFYNLIDVYIDAVFHPSITENTFRQEGWHIEAENPEGPWSYKGVVFNEMKGVYSSPESMLSEKSQQTIFPDTLYSLDSGGNPSVIPQLSYEEFVRFHATYYHPSNARFFFYGDDPEERRLEIVADAIASCPKLESPINSAIPLQAPFAEPIRKTFSYASTDEKAKSLFTINWLLCERKDIELSLCFEMLEYLLEGMQSAPLRYALISSGLGEDMTGGLETELRQMYFSTGLKGIADKDIPHAEKIIFDTLTSLAEKGFPKESIEASINRLEFSYRENNFGNFPRGLAAMLQALSAWLYEGGDPLDALAWEKPLYHIKKRLAEGEPIFEDLIRNYLLNNASRATVILQPDKGLEAKLAEEEQAKVNAFYDSCSPEKKRELCVLTQELQRQQVEPDSPEAMATIPNLSPADMPLKNLDTPIQDLQGTVAARCMTADLPTRGISYFSTLLPVPQIPPRLLPLLPFFVRLLRETGTARHSNTEIDTLLSTKSGGIEFSSLFYTHADKSTRFFFGFRGKSLYDKMQETGDLLQELIFEPCTNRDTLLTRFKEILLETKAGLERKVISSGNSVSVNRIFSRYTVAGVISESLTGVSALRRVRAMLDRFEAEKDTYLAGIEELRNLLFVNRGAIVQDIAEGAALNESIKVQEGILSHMPKKEVCDAIQSFPLAPKSGNEFFVTPSQVSYVAKGANIYDLGYSYHGSLAVILRYLKMGYLWEQVRVKGGAYGASCGFGKFDGVFHCSSYRDPNMEKTIQAFDAMADYLAHTEIRKDELDRAIVGAIGDIDLYMLPDARGSAAFMSRLTGNTDEMRQQTRDEILSTTPAHFKQFAEVLAAVRDSGIACAVGGIKGKQEAEALGWNCKDLFA